MMTVISKIVSDVNISLGKINLHNSKVRIGIHKDDHHLNTFSQISA